jgi:hypothetical protein
MSAATINTALLQGCNLLFTPGVYNLNQTLNVTHADTTILGIGFPTLIPQNGVNTMQVSDVNGVRIKGLLFDAGTVNSAALLTVGTAGSTASHASDPISLQDVFFRIGGDIAGKATASLVVNANDTLVDDIWAWRADHGNGGTVGWTTNTADNGMIVNGNNVEATGLFVEHYQKYEVTWNGQNGKVIFFQNEMPYDPPNQHHAEQRGQLPVTARSARGARPAPRAGGPAAAGPSSRLPNEGRDHVHQARRCRCDKPGARPAAVALSSSGVQRRGHREYSGPRCAGSGCRCRDSVEIVSSIENVGRGGRAGPAAGLQPDLGR